MIFWPQPSGAPRTDSLNVPLGVEQAAIVTYSGPPVTVAPYKWGVAVNVRIANVSERPGARIYDVRYLVNRGGTFDLKDYLAAADGAPLEGLPSFKFHGDPKLSQDLDARIRETEPIGIDVGGHYYATLTGLCAFWLVWLLLLIFYRRPPRPIAAAPAATRADARGAAPRRTRPARKRCARRRRPGETRDAFPPPLARRTRPRRPFHERRAPGHRPERKDRPALLRQVQQWLHQRASPLPRAEIAAALAPFAAEPPAAPAAPAPTPPARP